METATHIAIGNDAGTHFRKIAGLWHIAQPGQLPMLVTVQRTIDALDVLATIGQDS